MLPRLCPVPRLPTRVRSGDGDVEQTPPRTFTIARCRIGSTNGSSALNRGSGRIDTPIVTERNGAGELSRAGPLVEGVPGGYALARYDELSRRVKRHRRRRVWVISAVGVLAWLGAAVLLAPWSWADGVAALLLVIGGIAVALSAELDYMPAWVENWKTGGDGELATARQLAQLPSAWVVRHDLDRIPGVKGNVDHLVAGPAGVFVVETKNWGDWQVRVDSGRLRRVRRLADDRPSDAMDAIGQPKNAARHVHEALKSDAPGRFFVTPVLVIWADQVPDPVTVNGVWVVPGEQLADWLSNRESDMSPDLAAPLGASIEAL